MTGIADDAQTVTKIYDYDAFGNVPTMINYLPLYLPAFVEATLELSNVIGEVLPSITAKVGGVKVYEKNNMVHTVACVM
ncbi:MAG: hypothetical protein E7489_05700 [Ruminococcaceae bacterium]|nr:hypothetical protein [Oscillospiraceae bacterium]